MAISKNSILKILSLIALLLLITGNVNSQIKRVGIQQEYPVIQAETQIWIGTPSGLLQFNPDDNSFKRYALPVLHQNRDVKQMYYHQEWLWCVLDTGLIALHVRLNDCLYFDAKNGLPSPVVTNLDFEGDYIWASTNNGLARFDLLMEQWEVFDKSRGLPTENVNDVKVLGEHVWITHDNGFSEYNPLFEKWRNFKISVDTNITPKQLFVLKNEIWLVCDDGLVSFNPQLQSRQFFRFPYLNMENLIELYIEDERIWAVTRLGIYYFDKQSGIWNEFEGNNNLDQFSITFGFLNIENLWILTKTNVMVWDRGLRSWEIQDFSTGLSALDFTSVYSDGNNTFLFNDQFIDYQKSVHEPWNKYSFSQGTKGGRSNLFNNLFDNDEGGYIGLGKYKWNWEGTRIRIVEQLDQKFNDLNEILSKDRISAYRLNIKSQVDFSNMRRLSGFYNNVDYSDTILGLRYRGNDNDLLREAAWGDFRYTSSNTPFGEGAEMFGSNIWLQYGDKTPVFKRSLFSLKAATGQLKSKKTYEYFNGAFSDFSPEVKDIQYLKNQFFRVPGLDTLSSPENIRLYIDDKTPANNDPNTLTNTTIAGMLGNYDLWVSAEDYSWYTKANVLRMIKTVQPEWTIAIRYVLDGREYEKILQDETVSTSALNFYYLQGKQMLPFTFDFQIYDQTQAKVPLQQFGLDENGDDRVDSKWIDYIEGFLFFPDYRPFPPNVYDTISVESFYTMKANFQTQLSMIMLKHQNLVRGSEILRLDGIVASGGNDYVLDYTNGTLIFVREGIVNDDTRIEIEYEYYIENGSRFHQAGLSFSPSDNLYLQADWQNMSDDSTQMLDLHGEVRKTVGKIDFRLKPGIAYQTEENKFTAQHIEGLASSSWFRIKTLYQHFDSEYKNLYREQAFFGDVKDKLQFFSSVDATTYLRLLGDWQLLTGTDAQNNNAEVSERSGNASFLFHHTKLPNIQFTYQDKHTETVDSSSKKQFFQNLLEYQFPASVMDFMHIKNLKVENFLRAGSKNESFLTGSHKQRFFQGYTRVSAQVTERIQTGFFYRSNSVNDITGTLQKPVSKDERLLTDLVINEWRAMQISFRIENNLKQTFSFNDDLNVYYLRNFGQVNFRLSPGQFWKPLSLLFFEFNYNQTNDCMGDTKNRIGGQLWSFSQQETPNPTRSLLIQNYFIKNEIRPGGNWFLYSMLQWNTQNNGFSGSKIKKSSWRLNERLDIKVGTSTHIVVQYRQFFQNLGPIMKSMDYEPSIWVEHRWSGNFINIFNLLYRRNDHNYGKIHNLTDNYESSFDLIWRTKHFTWLRYMEIQQTFSGSYQNTFGYTTHKNLRMSSGTSFNFYPLQSLVIRLRADVNRFIDIYFNDWNYLAISFNLKVSMWF